MNIYKKKHITEIRDLIVKSVCDKCKREFDNKILGLGDKRNYKKECGSVYAKLCLETDYQIVKEYWQTQ